MSHPPRLGGSGRKCRLCDGQLSVFHKCRRLALHEAIEDLTLGVTEIEADGGDSTWEEIRRRFPLTAERIIAALNPESLDNRGSV